MKKEMLGIILFVLIAGTVVAFEQPTFVGLQGRVTDSAGTPVNNGNLRATVSTAPSCEQNIIYDYIYTGAVRAGLFSVLLGNDSNLNLTYNRDYYLCTYINGEVQRNLGGFNTTKFRGGQGIIGAGNLTNGTFTTGNYTFADNLTLGAWLFVKNDEDFLSRVLRAPIRYKDLVDRSAPENITGAWNFNNSSTKLGNIPVSDVGAGEWELVKWQNFTGSQTSINFSGFDGSNMYKLVYLFDIGGTNDNGRALGNVIRSINFTFNNLSANKICNENGVFYSDKYSSKSAIVSNTWSCESIISSPGILLISGMNASINNITFGELYVWQNQKGSITVTSNVPPTIGINDDSGGISSYNQLISGHLKMNSNQEKTLSEINFVSWYTFGSESAGGNFNGSIILYRHRYFRGW